MALFAQVWNWEGIAETALAPLLWAWVVGIVLAIRRWRKHPAVSLATITAFVLGFLDAFVLRALIYESLPGDNHLVKRVITSIPDGIMWVLLLVAIFGWRGKGPALD
jgi:hypothetical protein